MAFDPEITPVASAMEPTEPLLHVDRVKHLGPLDRTDKYTLDAGLYTLSDGTRYEAHILRPHKALHDIGVTYTTPWCTDLQRGGFNARVGHALANEGSPTVAVSPERLKTSDIGRLGRLTLIHDVLAHDAILRYIDAAELLPTRPGHSMGAGYSRGGMLMLGLEKIRKIPYADIVDPCLEHEVGVGDVNWPDLPHYVAEEVTAFIKALTHYSMHELIELGRGHNLSPRFWLQQIAYAKALFSGEAGKFAEGWNPDSVAHVTLYTGSRFNHAPEWLLRFMTLANIVVSEEPGHHLTGADPRVLKGTVGRIVLAQNMLRDGATPLELRDAVAASQPPHGARRHTGANYPLPRAA